MTTLIHQRVEAARRGENPTVICRMPSGWAVLADKQVLRGYALLLPDPVVPSLNDLQGEARAAYLHDMVLLGDALLEVTGAARINYEILGNTEPALHVHVIPRYADEPPLQRLGPVWFYDRSSAPSFDPERDRELMQQIAGAIGRIQAS